MNILGIETSCDETGVAIYHPEKGLLANALHSQVDIHRVYGGVVPELASRDHIQRILPLIDQVCQQANLNKTDLDGIAYTAGPGLAGALLVGASVSQALALAWQIPCIGVHHMEAHLLAPLLEASPPSFPFLALLVSGGHTQLVSATEFGHYELLGESVDDAAGEAFDKTARLLDLPYPGGPEIAKLAEIGAKLLDDQAGSSQHQPIPKFPRPMVNRPGLDFSFSGLKTFALNQIEAAKKRQAGAICPETKAMLAYAFEEAIVDTLTIKCRRALRQTGHTQLIIAGGVSANKRLRSALDAMVKTEQARLFYARPSLCTDNGAMVALTGFLRLQQGDATATKITVKPRWRLDELNGERHKTTL